MANIRTVRAFAQEEKEVEKYNRRIDKVLKLAYKDCLGKSTFFGLVSIVRHFLAIGRLPVVMLIFRPADGHDGQRRHPGHPVRRWADDG